MTYQVRSEVACDGRELVVVLLEPETDDPSAPTVEIFFQVISPEETPNVRVLVLLSETQVDTREPAYVGVGKDGRQQVIEAAAQFVARRVAEDERW